MQHQEKYNLTWDRFSDHLREALKEMMTSGEFADVTLVTDDRQQIRAHRNILSACSPLFKNILLFDSNNANPVIYLKGIQYSEMDSILQFIYLGEAKLSEERMSEFLMVSKNLEIKELSTLDKHEKSVADNLDEYNKFPLDEYSANVDLQAKSAPIIPNKSAKREVSTAVVSEDVKLKCKDCEKIFNSQPGLRYHIKSKHEGVKYACNLCDYEATSQWRLTTHIQSIHHEGVKKYACNQCEKLYTEQSKLTRHIQSVHDGVKYACNQCDKQYTEQSPLTRHIQSVHEGVKYNCNQCDYQATDRGHLKRHIKSQHNSVQ